MPEILACVTANLAELLIADAKMTKSVNCEQNRGQIIKRGTKLITLAAQPCIKLSIYKAIIPQLR
ncbi:hypothetical protein [Thiorhodovibrio winogradskyi]|uniref:hypothetical protein n=1 Tax=Thiorhodovibrio winogradskyi TaxID=77007 RepID=UPI002E2BFEA5|nr:hypothetical protein [Thiorhodovibrio winogradskyi]